MADDDPLSSAANALSGFANGPVAGATASIEAAVTRSFNAVSNTIARAALSGRDGLTTNTTNAIAFNHVAEDNKSWFNTATGRYTPQQAGLYMIILGVALNFSSSPGDSPQAYIFRNGSLLINGSYVGLPGAGNGAGSMAFGLVRFNGSTDYVDGRCFIPSGTSSIRGGISQTFFQGFRVAA